MRVTFGAANGLTKVKRRLRSDGMNKNPGTGGNTDNSAQDKLGSAEALGVVKKGA
jgi:hypothetical protein